jgi:hypothetical protein
MMTNPKCHLRTLMLVGAFFALPLALVASDCNALYDALKEECETAVDPILCMHNAHIAYCNCMGLQCT